MAVNYYLQYKNTFDFGNRVQRQYLYQNPRNFYRISRYENVDGEVKSLVGNNSSIILVKLSSEATSQLVAICVNPPKMTQGLIAAVIISLSPYK